MLTLPTLEGTTIRLRPLQVDDVPALCAIGLDPTLWRATTPVKNQGPIQNAELAERAESSPLTSFPHLHRSALSAFSAF